MKDNTMYDRSEVDKAIKPLLTRHLTKKPRTVAIFHIDGLSYGVDDFGRYVEPNPFKGKVIEITDLAIIVKDGPNSFKVCKKSLMSQQPAKGDNVLITPYYRKQFDGQAVGETLLEDTHFMNGEFIPKGRGRLFDEIAYLPGKRVLHEHTKILVNALQRQMLSDGYRTITHLLADLKANRFLVLDPPVGIDYGFCTPRISFDVKSPKCKERIEIIYIHQSQKFEINFGSHKGKVIRDIAFNDLAKVLEEQLDDASIKTMYVQILP